MKGFLFFLVLQLSLFSMGAAAVAVAVLSIRRPGRRWFYYVAAKLGFIITAGTVALRVAQNGGAGLDPTDWVLYAYLVGLASVFVGVTGVAVDVVKSSGLRIGLGLPAPHGGPTDRGADVIHEMLERQRKENGTDGDSPDS